DSVSRLCKEVARMAQASANAAGEIEPMIDEIETGFESIRRALMEWRGRDSTVEPKTAGASGKRILVIDDDEGIRRITHALVEELGHVVEPARDGLDGLAR